MAFFLSVDRRAAIHTAFTSFTGGCIQDRCGPALGDAEAIGNLADHQSVQEQVPGDFTL